MIDPANSMQDLAVLIPARRMEAALNPLVEALLKAGFGTIILVDDGSSPTDWPAFAALASQPRVLLVRHTVNRGKGRALKTGIDCFLNRCAGYRGLITADADGQHKVSDIVRVGQALLAHPQRAVLGARNFDGAVPLRSRIGNVLTRMVFGFASGESIQDTQTGLRGFPRDLLAGLATLEGERYEYEMSVLIHLCRLGRRPLEVPISTVYIENNRSSHFDPIRDSMRIYFVMVRYYASSLVAAGIDFALFAAVFWATHNILVSLLVGRISSLANYLINRRYVFKSGELARRAAGSPGRYAFLALSVAALSYVGIVSLAGIAHCNVLVAKALVDTTLSLLSFSMQRTLVFPQTSKDY